MSAQDLADRLLEHPTIPDTAEPVTAAGYAVAAMTRRSQHGQLCPVWTDKASVDRCNCWVLRNAAVAARTALDAHQKALDGDACPVCTPILADINMVQP